MRAKFIEITTFDREVDSVSPTFHIIHRNQNRFSYEEYMDIGNSVVGRDIAITEKVYNRVKLVDNNIPYIYFINFEEMRHAVPIVMSEINRLNDVHRKEIEDLRYRHENEINDLYPRGLINKLRSTIKLWRSNGTRLTK